MIFVTGPAFSHKKEYIMKELSLDEETWKKVGLSNAQDLVREKMSGEELEQLAEKLSRKMVVISDEVGSGVVPVKESERIFREQAGRLSVMLARRADKVIRVVCGLPQILKS